MVELQLSEQQIGFYTCVFDMFSKDGDMIPAHALKFVLRAIGHSPEERQVTAFITKLDGQTHLDLEEFLHIANQDWVSTSDLTTQIPAPKKTPLSVPTFRLRSPSLNWHMKPTVRQLQPVTTGPASALAVDFDDCKNAGVYSRLQAERIMSAVKKTAELTEGRLNKVEEKLQRMDQDVVWIVISSPLRSLDKQDVQPMLESLAESCPNLILASDWLDCAALLQAEDDMLALDVSKATNELIQQDCDEDSLAFAKLVKLATGTLWFHLYSGVVKAVLNVALSEVAMRTEPPQLAVVCLQGGPLSRCESHVLPTLLRQALAQIREVSHPALVRVEDLAALRGLIDCGVFPEDCNSWDNEATTGVDRMLRLGEERNTTRIGIAELVAGKGVQELYDDNLRLSAELQATPRGSSNEDLETMKANIHEFFSREGSKRWSSLPTCEGVPVNRTLGSPKVSSWIHGRRRSVRTAADLPNELIRQRSAGDFRPLIKHVIGRIPDPKVPGPGSYGSFSLCEGGWKSRHGEFPISSRRNKCAVSDRMHERRFDSDPDSTYWRIKGGVRLQS